MIRNKITKFATLAIGMTFVFGVVATPAGAQTIAELQTQINALMAQLAALQGGTVANPTACTFTRSLTIGTKGADVICLQNYLTGTGHFNYSGGSTGYFGSITRAAVAAWQAANGVAPAVGYFGPISQARYTVIASSAPGTPSAPCPAGYTCTPTGSGVITTPGVEGTVTVTLNPSPASGTKLYEGESMKAVLGIKLEAKTSDIRIERVKIDLDNVTSGNSDNEVYRKIASKIYVLDGSTVLGSMDLNSSTVVQDGSDYFVTIAGLNFVVLKDETKVLTIALDAHSTWDSAYDGDSWSLGVPVDGIRGIDGAGINQYGPSTAFTRNFTSSADILDSASLAVSLASNTPETQQVICESGTSNDECDGLEVARFNFKAEDDDVLVTDFVLDLVRGGATVATATTAYLYDGSTLVGSATVAGTSVTAMTATFSDIDWTVPSDTTRTLSIKLDIDDAALAADTFVASTDAGDTTAENSVGDTVTATGSADGKTITIRNVGPEITLVSKSITTSGVPQGAPAVGLTSTSTLTATFNVRVTALGGDIYLGKIASSTSATESPVFEKTGANNSFTLYKEGVASSVNHATSTSYTIPSTCVTATPAETCTLAEGASVDIQVTYLVPGRIAAGTAATSGLYAVGLEKVNWAPASTGAIQSTTFMAGLTDWRTSSVSFP